MATTTSTCPEQMTLEPAWLWPSRRTDRSLPTHARQGCTPANTYVSPMHSQFTQEETMTLTKLKTVAVVGIAIGLLNPPVARAFPCWYEAANWNPSTQQWQCLGTGCGYGWCCKICEKL